jgi:phosphatidylserine/phosphatidylglycerophosphate/cardiolipin synthase-like enzyme
MTRRSIVVALVAGLALALLMQTAPPRTVPAAQRLLDYTPTTGPIFNRPVGTQAEQRAIFRHINNTIDATPPGATIRFAVYSFAEKATATRLINAHQRGVNVQMIFNKHTVYPQETRLQAALGKNAAKRSFAIFCEKSCRGDKGNMHQKVFLFSKAGQAENIVMVGSNNMTRNNAVNQWSDVYTVVDDPALYFTYSGVFEQMKADRAQLRPYIAATVNDYGPEFYPYPRVTQANDPLYQALSQITCTGAAEGYGTETAVDADEDGVLDRVTAVRLSQHAWNGDRGIYLAQKVSELKRAGCDVKVIAGVGFGRVVKNTLIRNEVPISFGKVKGKDTHQKAFYVSGVFAGDPASARVWTGSHNWSDGALRRDDAVLEITGLDVYNQYLANFQDIWLNG